MNARRADIQGLRAVAVVLIVAFHADGLVPGGFFAVDIFFVISGFVITAMLLREHASTATISLRTFYARRLRRLFPSLALMVSVVLLASLLVVSPFTWGELAPAGASSIFAVSNVYFAVATDGYFDPAANTIPFLHTWSLAVEEQFYLVFPSLALLLLARGRSRRGLTWVVAVLTAASFALCVVLTLVPLPGALSYQAPRLAFDSPMSRVWEFGVGALVALALPVLTSGRFRRLAGPAGWGGVAVLALAFVVVDEASFPGWGAALPVLATALVLAAGALDEPGRRLLGRGLSTRPMTWLGDRSYTWYLWHWPLIVVAAQWWPGSRTAAIGAALVALVVAAVVYRTFENPIHRGTFGRGRSLRTVLVGSLVVPLAACAVVAVASATSLGDGLLREQRAVVAAQHLDQVRGCDAGFVVGDGVPAGCRWEVDDARGRMLLIGDSHAGHYTEAFLDAAGRLGYAADVATFPSCPFVLDGPGDATCRSFVRDNVDALASGRADYDLVVVSTAALNTVRDPSLSGTRSPTAGWWAAEVERTLAPVARRTTVVDVVDNVQFPRLMTCVRRSVLTSTPAPGCLEPGELDQSLHDAAATAQRTAMEAIGGHVLDDTAAWCGGSAPCEPVGPDAVPRFRDVSHLTVRQSHALADEWSRRLAEALRS